MNNQTKTPGAMVLVPRELLERVAQWGSVSWMDKNELIALLAAPAAALGEPVAWQYKEYVWATGLQASVWRDKLEPELPDPESQEIKDLIPLYRHAQPATAKVDERAEFENWHALRYPFHSMLLSFDEDCREYIYPSRRDLFNVWQARSKLNGVEE